MTFEPNDDGGDPWDRTSKASSDLRAHMRQLKTRYREERRKLESRSFAPVDHGGGSNRERG